MRWFTSLFLATMISLGIAFVLSALSGFNESNPLTTVHHMQDEEEQVFERDLRNDNLVDHFVRLPLKLKILRVDWNHSMLTVDLKITNEENDPAVIYHDLVELSRFGLDATNNVKQVLVRVFHHEKIHPDHDQLLIALDARRDQWSSDHYERLMNEALTAEQFLRDRFSLHYSKYWQYFVGMVNGSREL